MFNLSKFFNKSKSSKEKNSESEIIYDLTGVPNIDRKDFNNLMADDFFKEFSKQAIDMNKNGFCTLEINTINWINLIDTLKSELEELEEIRLINKENPKPIRFQDAWLHKKINTVRDLAIEPKILQCLKILYGRDPFPFQTLNFPYGSRQHFHSDAVHFNSLPRGFMCGIWIALEDIHKDSGPLIYYPKSHKLPYISAKDLGLSSRDLNMNKYPQKLFESYWINLVKEKGYEKKQFIAKKGEILIWHANLLHGGDIVINKNLTRWSQVTHYYFKNCGYFTPMHTTKEYINNLRWREPFNIIEN